MQSSRAQRVGQRRCADKLERCVDAAWEEFVYLPGNIAVIDQDVVHADIGQGCGLVRAARC